MRTPDTLASADETFAAKKRPNQLLLIRFENVYPERATTTHADALLQRLEEIASDDAATKTAKAALHARFVTYDLPPDFVVNLRNQDEVQGGVENTELICQLLGRASDDVTELDAIMHNKLARQPEKLRVWQSASRVERGAQREKKLANVVAVDPAVVQLKAA